MDYEALTHLFDIVSKQSSLHGRVLNIFVEIAKILPSESRSALVKELHELLDANKEENEALNKFSTFLKNKVEQDE